MTRIKNKYVKRESSRIGKTIEYNQIEKQLNLIKPEKKSSQIGSKTVTSKTVGGDDGDRSGGPDVALGIFVMRWCACGERI